MLLLCLFPFRVLFKNLREGDDKYCGAQSGSCRIRYSLCGVDPDNSHEGGKKVSQGHKKDDLPKKGDKERDLCLAESYEGVLAGSLKAKYRHTEKEDGHILFDYCDNARIVGKGVTDKSGAKNHKEHTDKVYREHNRHGDLEALLHPVILAVAKVVAENRDNALTEACERYADYLHCALHNRESRNVHGVAVGSELAVKREADKTLCACHNEGRDTEGGYFAYNREARSHMLEFKS